MVNVYIGIGSNLGNEEDNIKKSIGLIGRKLKVLKISSLYETEPVGYEKQNWFLNCIIEASTTLTPQGLLGFLQSIEKVFGRIATIKNGPRIIDLDILFYGNRVINQKNLIVPHPRLHQRLFVLKPLNEISPDFIHPILKKSIKELYSEIDKSKIVRLSII